MMKKREALIIKKCFRLDDSEEEDRNKAVDRLRFLQYIRSDNSLYRKRVISKPKNNDIGFNKLLFSKTWTTTKSKKPPNVIINRGLPNYRKRSDREEAKKTYNLFLKGEREVKKFIVRNKISILKIAIIYSMAAMRDNKKEQRFYTYSQDSKEYFNNIINEKKGYFKRKRSDLPPTFRDTDIFKTSFSDEIYHQGENENLSLYLIIPSSVDWQNNTTEFNFKYLSEEEYKNLNSEEKEKVIKINKIPISLSQIIKNCVEEESNNIHCFGVISKKDIRISKFILHMAKSLFFDPGCNNYLLNDPKDRHSLKFYDLFLYNAVLFLLNPKCPLFSPTPLNYFSMKLYFFMKSFYLKPNEYVNELKVFKNNYLTFLPKDDVLKILINRMFINERNIICGLKLLGKGPHKNNFPKSPAFPIMPSSIFNMLLKDLKLIERFSSSKINKGFRKNQVSRKCKNVIMIFLGLVYGLDWKKMKMLTNDDVLNLILGVPSDAKSFIPHILGLPSMVLFLLGINPIERYSFSKRSKEGNEQPSKGEWNSFIHYARISENPATDDGGLAFSFKKESLISSSSMSFQSSSSEISENFIDVNKIILDKLNSSAECFKKKLLRENKEGGDARDFIFPNVVEINKSDDDNNNDCDNGDCDDDDVVDDINNRSKEFFKMYCRDTTFNLISFMKKNGSEEDYTFCNIGDIALLAFLKLCKLKNHLNMESKMNFENAFKEFKITIREMLIQDYITHGGDITTHPFMEETELSTSDLGPPAFKNPKLILLQKQQKSDFVPPTQRRIIIQKHKITQILKQMNDDSDVIRKYREKKRSFNRVERETFVEKLKSKNNNPIFPSNKSYLDLLRFTSLHFISATYFKISSGDYFERDFLEQNFVKEIKKVRVFHSDLMYLQDMFFRTPFYFSLFVPIDNASRKKKKIVN
uniref:Uncharacterized protein n=1 Tax=Armadillidium vulgare clopovirus TaxID=2984284 RepID=A0A9C7EZ68_9VIRU|nr:MAG: hypothetical protein [Armadillidium vulgare clopovirus]